MSRHNVKSIIEKWYKKLNFPGKYDAEFYDALNEIEIQPISISQYDITQKDGRKNLLSYLYMCEEISAKYAQKGIDEEILLDTLADLVRWTETWSGLKGSLYFGETGWLRNHLGMNLFELGRLQYAFGEADWDVAKKNIKKGDNVIKIHIPGAGPLIKEDCERSLEKAKEFFKEFYPEYEYKYFTCHSWLLDETLKEILKPESNILSFQSLFEISGPEESYDIIKYVLKWDATKETVNSYVPATSFAKKVQERVNEGKAFYAALGVIGFDN